MVMDLSLLIKVIVASISVVIALVAGIIELRLNPNSWLYRLFFYVIFKYTRITKKVEEATKKRIQWFSVGVIIIIVGIVINLIGGFLGNILIEIFALILLDLGIFVIVKGFLI